MAKNQFGLFLFLKTRKYPTTNAKEKNCLRCNFAVSILCVTVSPWNWLVWWLFLQRSTIIDIWQGAKYVFCSSFFLHSRHFDSSLLQKFFHSNSLIFLVDKSDCFSINFTENLWKCWEDTTHALLRKSQSFFSPFQPENLPVLILQMFICFQCLSVTFGAHVFKGRWFANGVS